MNETQNLNDQILNVQQLLANENPQLAEKFQTLCRIIEEYESAVIAFSGGVDSSLLAYLGHLILDKSLSVTADSPTLPRKELSEANDFAKMYKLNHRVISYNELEDANFIRNDKRRCFYCKDGLFKTLDEIKEKDGYEWIIDGSNFDDLDDYRPGREAAEKNNVKSPLIEAELGKKDIRLILRTLELPTWDKPQMACLSSRFARDIPIDREGLLRIEKAEYMVKELGYKDVRVRLHGEVARVEIGKNEEIDIDELKALVPKIKELGFKYVTLDLEGYRTGSLNE
jgi:uncharacterized protein